MLKTVEVPLAGHPDKVCDQIVEALLDEYLRRDPKSRVSLKACGSHGMLMIAGTVDSKADFDASSIAKKVYKEIGYTDDLEPFINIERPSEDLARRIVSGGAQGTCVVYGYATKETREMLPRSLVYASSLARRVDDLRKHDPMFSFLKPDGKIQLTMDGERVVAVTLLVQHTREIQQPQIQSAILSQAIEPILGATDGVQVFINSSGSFETGGFMASAGASGRKVLSDTYGGLLPYGGAAFIGRDPLRPSRAATYMSRHVAKQLVARGLAGNVLVHASYAIGRSEPVCLEVKTGKGEDLSELVKEEFDFRPEAIVERLDLQKPVYQALATYGQFGRDEVSWERTEKKGAVDNSSES
ncbi:methionine adenosyltransferase domain-containing protein [Candidatus Uhrbacteria bacterium]|jgi:S-adenosylmethionine synthetase|nr:methionine adenosyltransferase domain-containing protein [Candidatus Uhrbacteria bacterium]